MDFTEEGAFKLEFLSKAKKYPIRLPDFE